MYTTIALPLLAVVTLALGAPTHLVNRDVDPKLVPPFGITAGTNPDGTGNCDGTIGANGKPVLIPCACPPAEDVFLQSLNANVDAGHAVNNPPISVVFPTDSSVASQITRIQAVLVTLQNLHGPGVGCPAASTNLVALQKTLQSGGSPPPAAPAPAAPAPATSPAASPATTVEPSSSGDSSSNSSIAAIAPPLGFSSGVNPTGTGDCDGAVNGANGQPIKVPCTCPPSQDVYISQLEANAAAGHAVHNPTVAVSFPLDNSPNSQRARIQAALVTIQNLNGPGVGCPAASTTLSAQLAAVQG